MSQNHALPHAVALNARISLFGTAAPCRSSFVSQLKTALTVARTRRALNKADSATLADIGLSAEAARMEARRAFFDIAPQTVR